MNSVHPGMHPLIERLEAAVGQSEPTALCRQVKEALTDALRVQRNLVPEPYLAPVPDGYARRLVHKDPKDRFSIVMMVWGPGQGTPLHDHAGHWCVECVYRGRIRVCSFDVEEDGGNDQLRFEQKSEILAGLGEAGALIPPHEYHTIENPDATTAVTLHVYAGEITWCNVFEPTEREGWFRRQRREMGYVT